jgi:hypothetical protein
MQKPQCTISALRSEIEMYLSSIGLLAIRLTRVAL